MMFIDRTQFIVIWIICRITLLMSVALSGWVRYATECWHKPWPDVILLLATVASRHRRHNNPREANETVLSIFKNHRSLPKRLWPTLKDHAFDLVHRCLPTRHRIRHKQGRHDIVCCVATCTVTRVKIARRWRTRSLCTCPVAKRARGLSTEVIQIPLHQVCGLCSLRQVDLGLSPWKRIKGAR